jgi:16S rRNA (cytidine1402-2'-O)-methyltransferase
MKELANETRTMIFYESPHRLLKTLEELSLYLGAERQASVSRELTKMFEETVRGTLQEIKIHFETHTLKGEIVICVAGK